MSRFAINPNKLPNQAAEERAALERESAFENDGAMEAAPETPGDKLPPRLLMPDPRYPHGDVDEIEARLARLRKVHGHKGAPQSPPSEADRPARAASAAEYPLIASLIAALPPPHSVWSAQDRATWLRAAECVFHLVYRAEANVDIDARSA